MNLTPPSISHPQTRRRSMWSRTSEPVFPVRPFRTMKQNNFRVLKTILPLRHNAGPVVTPAELPPSSGPAELPPSSGPAELPPSSGPAELPPSSGPAELPPSSGPAELPPSSGSTNTVVTTKLPSSSPLPAPAPNTSFKNPIDTILNFLSTNVGSVDKPISLRKEDMDSVLSRIYADETYIQSINIKDLDIVPDTYLYKFAHFSQTT